MASSIACILFNLSAGRIAMSLHRLHGKLSGNCFCVDSYDNPQSINEFTQRLSDVIQHMPDPETSAPFCK